MRLDSNRWDRRGVWRPVQRMRSDRARAHSIFRDLRCDGKRRIRRSQHHYNGTVKHRPEKWGPAVAATASSTTPRIVGSWKREQATTGHSNRRMQGAVKEDRVVHFQITIFSKSAGPLTKHICLDVD